MSARSPLADNTADPVPSGEALLRAVKAYWNRRPCNIRHSTAPVGTRDYFDEVEARKYFVEPHIPAFAQFERWKGKRVLEIGCGIGTAAVGFARAGADLTAVDLSEDSLALCRRRLEVYNLKAHLYCANAEELIKAVPSEPYDLIYSFGVIHHTPYPDRVIESLRHYCGPHTELRIMLYAKWSWKVLWIVFTYGYGAFWRVRELVARYSEAEIGCPVTYVYSKAEAKALLRGFDIIQIRKDHIFPYRIDKYVKYEYQRVWYFRWLPRWAFRQLEALLGWHMLIVARPSAAHGRKEAGDS
jgi:SAM-dependent methyltransferase